MTPDLPAYRLVGLDVARGLAIVCMVLVNFAYTLSATHAARLATDDAAASEYSFAALAAAVLVFQVFAGRAAATFLVLFGIGLALQLERAGPRRAEAVLALVRRYAALIALGFVFAVALWPPDILHYIGLFGLLALLLASWSSVRLLGLALALPLAAHVLRSVWDYGVGWQPGAVGMVYADMWTLTGLLRQLLFNGFHPLVPWFAFVAWGLWLAKQDVTKPAVQKRMVVWGVPATLLGYLAQALGLPGDFFPPTELFVLLGMAAATALVGLCLCLVRTGAWHGTVRHVANLGRLALSHYVGHVLFGIAPLWAWSGGRTDMPLEASTVAALVYVFVGAALGNAWLSSRRQGPLEALLARFAQPRRLARSSELAVEGDRGQEGDHHHRADAQGHVQAADQKPPEHAPDPAA